MTDLRPAIVEDAKQCAAILQDWLDRTEWMPDLHSLDETVAFCRTNLIGEFETTVAGAPVEGFVSLEPDNSIAALYVARPGHGIGSALLTHAKSRKTLKLWTFQANEGAIRFYERHGFREVLRTDGSGNQENLPDIKMEWNA